MTENTAVSTTATSAMLLGTYTPKLDDKFRFILPPKFRTALADGLVITRGQEGCLYVLPASQFQKMYSQIESAPLADKKARDYLRIFLSGATDDLPDKQGRVTIPATLREYANIERELVLTGVGTRLELWDAATWETYLANNLQTYSDTEHDIFGGAA